MSTNRVGAEARLGLTQLPAGLQKRIRVTHDGHWIWTGGVSNPHTHPAPLFCKAPVRRLVWEEIEYLLGRDENVTQTCPERMCVNPQHAKVGRRQSVVAA